ncbi:MAG: lactate utilization protein [Clostridia bacterium]|nr:lactate utilization protein [Clostridia bacterium]
MDFESIKNTLMGKGYKVTIFDSAKDACDYLEKNICNTTVGIGGSMTVQEMGLYDRLAEHNRVFWHTKADAKKTNEEVKALANTAEIYISSVNGLAETGEIVNIDGACNRVSSICYGHKKVYFIVGQNKIAKNYEDALYRARNIAAPKNAKRLGKRTPCAIKGDKCYNCNSPERICRVLSVWWEKPSQGEYEIVLIKENLGY